MGRLEHVNITVADGAGFAAMLGSVFGWRIRWEGPASDGSGYSRHVGDVDSYVAVFENDGPGPNHGMFNHLGVVVDDLIEAEARVLRIGLRPHHHADYEPGRRFYFMSAQGVEIEVVSYAAKELA